MFVSSPIKLYYFRAHGLINFGDDLSPKIVEMVTGKPVEWAHPTRCDLAALGSILQRLVKHRRKRLLTAFGRKITVWGSGFIEPQTSIRASDFEFLAVRGPNTAALIKNLDHPIFGDPGILLAELASKPVAKKYEWGIIPHYHDLADPMISALAEATPSATVISVRDDPIETLYKIKSCEKVVSSSLHGLIAADCFHIPNWRLKISDKVVGNHFKFEDYARAIGRQNISPIVLPPMGLPNLNQLEIGDFTYYHNISVVGQSMRKILAQRY